MTCGETAADALDVAELVPQVLALAQAAGADIMAIYNAGSVTVTHKGDQSPVTSADLAAHTRIVAGLGRLTPHIPVVSEEGALPEESEPSAPMFWLVDPLDGTREFVARNGEFTVNIALISEGRAVMGVVVVPAQGLSYWGGPGLGAFRRGPLDEAAVSVRVAAPRHPDQPLRVMASRSHLDDATRAWLAQIGPHELVQAGSSLKLCRIAEGSADVYPRLGPTCEWDTAAAQAVVEAAGGQVYTLQGETLRYGKAGMRNPHFVVSAVPWRTLLQA